MENKLPKSLRRIGEELESLFRQKKEMEKCFSSKERHAKMIERMNADREKLIMEGVAKMEMELGIDLKDDAIDALMNGEKTLEGMKDEILGRWEFQEEIALENWRESHPLKFKEGLL